MDYMEILPQLVLNSIIAGSIYALVALGFNLIFSVTKFFNLAHGVLAAVGGYVVFFFFKTLGWNLFLAVALGMILAGMLGFFLDKIIYLPLRRRKASNLVLLVASLGAFTVLQAILAILFTSQFQTLSGESFKVYEIFGPSTLLGAGGSAAITDVQLLMLVSAIILFFGLFFLLKYTTFGKAVRAIGDDEEVARIVGINTDKIIGRVFFIGSAISGLAGILIGFDTGIEPTMGLPLLLKGIIGAIVGGVGSLSGGILGSFLLGFVENFGIWKISGEWKDAIAFLLLILFLIFRPTGIIKK